MNLWVRLFFLSIRLLFSNKKKKVFDTFKIKLRVYFNDLDVYRHVNNGRYLTLLDLGRAVLFYQSGLQQILKSNDLYFVVSNETITFRKSLTLFMKFEIQTKIIGCDLRSIYFEQRFVRKNEIYAQAFIRIKLVRKKAGVVSIAELSELLNLDLSAKQPPAWLADWVNSTRLLPTNAISNW